MGMMLAGCCSAGGVCGFDLSVVGLGCGSLSAFGSFLPIEAGPPQPCGDAASPSGDAAGE
jgi:hypothetical protein